MHGGLCLIQGMRKLSRDQAVLYEQTAERPATPAIYR